MPLHIDSYTPKYIPYPNRNEFLNYNLSHKLEEEFLDKRVVGMVVAWMVVVWFFRVHLLGWLELASTAEGYILPRHSLQKNSHMYSWQSSRAHDSRDTFHNLDKSPTCTGLFDKECPNYNIWFDNHRRKDPKDPNSNNHTAKCSGKHH